MNLQILVLSDNQLNHLSVDLAPLMNPQINIVD